MSTLSRWRKRRALRREQESLEFYAALAGGKGRWGQRYRDHVAEHGPLSDVWGHEQMLRQMTPVNATSLPETAQNAQARVSGPANGTGELRGNVER